MAQADLIERIFFAICSVVIVMGAIGTVAFPNPIRGALSLLFTIVALAGLYLQLHAPFLAAIQLIVYAGAVVVLFLFVIMLIGPAAIPPKDSKAIVARVAGGIAGSAIAVLVILVLAKKTFPRGPAIQSGFGSVEAIGELLFSDYIVPFEVASLLLMVAIVGAVAVARGKQPDPQLEEKVLADDRSHGSDPAELPAHAPALELAVRPSSRADDVRKPAVIDRSAP